MEKDKLESFIANQVSNIATGNKIIFGNQAATMAESVRQLNDSRVKHIYDLNAKYSIAVACFLFVLIGAPMAKTWE